MALRRLFSGWLIAMAALARSVAQALERASEDRPSSAPDPVMAALAERYPGAPTHWLAHVAERTSQLADTGQAPFSLNSDPTVWTQSLPDGTAQRPLATDEASIAKASRRVEPAPDRDGQVPSLAALRDRSSEVWRRPDAEPRPRPRPVFAAAAPSEKLARPAKASGAEPPRPRARLTVVGSPSQQAPNMPEPRTPPSEPPAAKTIVRTAAWSEAPSSEAALDAPKVSPDFHETKAPPRGHAFAQAPLKQAPLKTVSDDPPEADTGPAARSSAPRRRRAWFFASSPAGRLGRRLDLSPHPEPGPREGGALTEGVTADDPPFHPAFPYSSLEPVAQPAEAEKAWRALTPPNARRPLFQMLAALRARPRPDDAAEAAVATESSIGAEPRRHEPPSSVRPSPIQALSPASPVPSERPASAFQRAEGSAPPAAEGRVSRHATVSRARRPSGLSVATAERQGADKRPAFAAPRPAGPGPSSRRFVDRPSDDRWPALPPTALTAPPVVETASPRWDQLAREQEEGRWSV